ncbi:MAG: DMT family transporter [Caldilineaceae bacterium]|nr:DMT family transporter [Caldilineaceae bacterium]
MTATSKDAAELVAESVNPLPTRASWVGWSLAFGSMFASGLVTPLARGVVVGGMDPISLLLARLLLAMILLAGTLAVVSPARFRIEARAFWRIAGVGLIAGVEICCFFWSLSFVDASMTAMIKSTQPLVVLLLLTVGGERLTRRHILRVLLSMIGIYLLIGLGGRVAPFGLFLLMLSMLLYALQLVFTQWWLSGYDVGTLTLYLTGVMTVVIAGWWAVQGAHWHDPGRTGWIVIVVLAVVSTYLARLALYAAIARIGSGQIALLWPLQTLTIIFISVLFLDERFTLIQGCGGLLILASALLAINRVYPTRPRRLAV